MAEDFTIEAGTLTPTLKVRRKEVMKKYEAEI
jgi:long-subunit acyl-CoA synthetase (AMP-forming)